MSQQIQITGGAKVRDLQDVIIGTSGVLSSLGFDVANGVPKLDSNGKILVSQLPNSVMEYKGSWNVVTNTPTLVNGTGNAGDVYLVTNAATTGTSHDFGAGAITFYNGDQVIYSGSIWQRASGATGSVTSVGLSTNGGAITIGSSPITTSGTISFNFNGTNLQYVNGAGNLTTFPTLMTSVGLTMPSAFTVTNSPLTGAGGTLSVTGAGVASQYIRGDGTLADFPSSGGGGSSVSYYLNGGTSQGTIGGTTYYEMSKTADTGTGVDFTKTGDGFIVAFLTDANDPAQLNIPAGNWNYEIYASMSANGGTPQMYAELYKYDGTTFTLISTSSNEILYDGTNLNLYTFGMTVPATTLALTDRLAIKLYATNSGGKTTTVHTQDSHLCQVITTFSTGITALNGLTAQVQYFQTGTSGTDFNISSTTATHTFNIPDASATARGLITTGTQTIAGAKTFSANPSINVAGQASLSILSSTGNSALIFGYVNNVLKGTIDINATEFKFASTINSTYKFQASGLGIASLIFNNTTNYSYTFPNATGTLALTSDLTGGTVTSVAALTIGTSGTDLSSSVATGTTTPVITLNVPTASASNRGALSSADWSAFNAKQSALTFSSPLVNTSGTISIPAATNFWDGYLSAADYTTFFNKQNAITLTTTGTSGAATFTSNTLNIPNYGSALSGYLPLTGGTLTGALSGTSASFSGTGRFIGALTIGTDFAQLLPISSSNYQLLVGSYYDGTNIIATATSGSRTVYNVGNIDFRTFTGATVGSSVTDTSRFTIASTGAATFSSSVTAGASSLFNAGTGALSADILTIKGGGGSGAFGFRIEANNGDDIFYTNNFSYNVIANPVAGNFLIGTTTDAGYKLDVNGSGRFIATSLPLRIQSTTNYETSTLGTATGTMGYISSNGLYGMTMGVGNSGNTWFQSQRVDGGTSAYNLLLNPNGGNVGIGATGPVSTLEVYGSSQASPNTSNAILKLNTATTNALVFGTLSGSPFACYIQSGGSNTYPLALNPNGGNVLIGTTTNNTGLLQVNGTIYATGFFESSSIKGKDIIATNPLLALDIDVIKYTRKSDESKDIRYGYSAEQIHSLMPELTDKDVTAVKYLDVHTILISQLQKEIKELKAKMN